MAGDRVLLHGEPGEIEFVSDSPDDENRWYFETYGGGVMVAEPKVFGRLFIASEKVSAYEDLEFVSRGRAQP
jgi:hypothetical protein